MGRVARRQTHKTRRLYGLIGILILLAAAGAGLYRYPPSLLDRTGFYRLAADKIPGASADLASAEPVLRGTIFDRAFRELAVSYPLYSLYIRPGEVRDPAAVAQAVAAAVGSDKAVLEAQLKQAHHLVKVADNLEAKQVQGLLQEPIAGVHLKLVEKRFYPGHEAAAGLIGYTGDNIGLAGVEGAYDMFLQHGEFRSESLPEIDFQDTNVVGRSTVDLLLTVDLTLQKEIERRLQEYLEDKQADKGLAICLDVKSGAVLAWAGRPSYNPNYYWQLAERTGDAIFKETLDPALYRDFLVRAAAMNENGELGDPLPPATVAAIDYGLSEEQINGFASRIGFNDAGAPWLPVGGADPGSAPVRKDKEAEAFLRGHALQIARAAASLVNGGWYVVPHVLAGVYAHEGKTLFSRSAAYDGKNRRQVVSPAMGIRLRRELFAGPEGGGKAGRNPEGESGAEMIIHAASVSRNVDTQAGPGVIMQDLLLGVIPARSPVLLLLMVAQREQLNPLRKPAAGGDHSQGGLARQILPALLAAAQIQRAVEPPQEKDPANFTQFLISRRMDYQEHPGGEAALEGKMPEVIGLSLRKGLQRLNPYHLLVNVEGSGRIVEQRPPAGTPLQGVGECTLILDSKQ